MAGMVGAARAGVVAFWWFTLLIGPVFSHFDTHGLTHTHVHTFKAGGVKQLVCHDCPDNDDCLRLMNRGQAGKCTTKEGGIPKCFIRMDPNGLIYRGCADHGRWPKNLDLDYNGCMYQPYGEWSSKKVPWCLCDTDLCNVNIQGVLMRYGEALNRASSGHSTVVKYALQPAPVVSRPVPVVPRPAPVVRPVQTVHYRVPVVPMVPAPRVVSRPMQKRVVFYKPLSYSGEPLEKAQPRPQPRPQPPPNNQQPSWYDKRQPANNQPWAPPADTRPYQPPPRVVYYTTPAPEYSTRRQVFTTPPPVSTTGMRQDLGPFEHSKDVYPPTGEVEGKKAPSGDGENDVNKPFDLSSIPEWVWGKIFPRPGDDGRQAGNGPRDDLGPNSIPQGPEGDRHTCRTMKCEHECIIKDNHPFCVCPTGYQLKRDDRSCEDINECLTRNGDCSHDCRNTIGSYLCMCPAGYTLDVDEKTCQDYNECLFETNLNCEHSCRNIAGSYECVCRPGYVLNSDGKSCDDIDECREKTHSCDHLCVNSVGSYTCQCRHGYYLDANERTCRDVNECRVENGGCEQSCQNTAGSHECRCNRGYVLNVDGKTCDDVDECREENGGCDHICWNTPGSFECRCRTGYQLDTDLRSCIDVNECLEENGGCDHICQNIEGSFRCLCRSGFTLNVDLRTCNAIDKCSVNNGGCEHVCTNTPSGARCSCHPGFMLRPDARSCADINECQANNGGCDHICVNTLGSHQCSCRPGYRLNVDNATCDDINECDVNLGGCSQQCENIPGSYRCTCNPGYRLSPNGRQCLDINECLTGNGGCQQTCTNTPGSFRCSCDGIIYRLHSDGRRCIGTCPADFVKSEALSSCYKVFTPQLAADSMDVASAQEHCRSLHPLGGLLSIQSDDEQRFLSNMLKREPQMLEGWQGWWTSGSYQSGINLFRWSDTSFIDNDSPFWGFRKTPVEETCVWILSISVYNQTWGNYDCFTKSGHICEVELPSK